MVETYSSGEFAKRIGCSTEILRRRSKVRSFLKAFILELGFVQAQIDDDDF